MPPARAGSVTTWPMQRPNSTIQSTGMARPRSCLRQSTATPRARAAQRRARGGECARSMTVAMLLVPPAGVGVEHLGQPWPVEPHILGDEAMPLAELDDGLEQAARCGAEA